MNEKQQARLKDMAQTIGSPGELKAYNQVESLQQEIDRLNSIISQQRDELLNLYRRLN